jgi:non-ribosomal peptide synthetase component F
LVAFAGVAAGAATTGTTTASTAFATFFDTTFAAEGTEADIIPEAVVLLIARIRTLSKHKHSILGQSL